MNYKLGDFVRFVDENLEGYITRIIDKDTIGVTDANDFEIPVLASKVTLVHGEVPEDEITASKQTTITAQTPFVSDGIYLAIVSDQHSNSVGHFYLVNETSFQLPVSFSTEQGGNFKGEFVNIIAAGSTKKIYSAQLGDIHSWPKFRLEILYHTSLNIAPKPPIVFHQSIKGKDLSVAKQEITLLKQKGWLIKLDQPEAIIDADKLKASFFK
ncbi:hypothetical protein [Pedobacter frigoris]|uniref:DUF2027 domain-containing protein n=1 Tax=Pedobacter frigoris TaxID=2571272 RepID=A0A4U1CKV3_9SPHI|nr:hypothetical protein [Pedobacter frigoris]TKC07286.1 hypothetical protein FA047_08500 [Pedobacter frigoris]